MPHSSAKAHGVVERQNADEIAHAQTFRPRREIGNDQIGRSEHAVVGVVVFGKPGFVEPQLVC
jgi:hypothetical protein